MVVMEYIDGETLTQIKEETNAQATEKVQLELRRALDLLYDHGMVFGDLRPPNIMIIKANEVKLTGLERTDKLSTLTWCLQELIGQRV